MGEPLVTPAAMAQCLAAVRVALAAEGEDSSGGSPGGRAAGGGSGLTWSVPADEFMVAVRLQRVQGILGAQVAALDAPPAVSETLVRAARGAGAAALQLALETERAVAALEGADIPVLVLKGVALSVQTTGTAAGRGAGDIDLLVRPSDVERAHGALAAAGWHGDPIPDDARWWARYQRWRRERTYVGPSSQIDLHWRVGWHEQPLPGVDVLLGRSAPVVLARGSVPTLSLGDAFVTACYSAAVDRYARLRSLIDIARLARRDDVVIPEGTSWRARRLVAESVALAEHVIGGIGAARVAALDPHGAVDLDRVTRIHEQARVRQAWIYDDLPLGAMIGIYRDSARLGGGAAATAMALVDGLLPPERVPPGVGRVGAARAVGTEIIDLLRRRVLPGAPSVRSDPSPKDPDSQ